MLGDSRAVEVGSAGGQAAAGEDTGGVAVAHRPTLGGVGATSRHVDGIVAIDDPDPEPARLVLGEGLAGHVGDDGTPAGDLRDSVLQTDERFEIDDDLHLGGRRLLGGTPAEEIQQDVGALLVEGAVVGELAGKAVDVGNGGVEPIGAYSLRS